MTVCRLDGAVLLNSGIIDYITTGPTACLKICLQATRCLSVNYHNPSQVCTLNNKLDLNWPDDLVVDPEYVHLAGRTCH